MKRKSFTGIELVMLVAVIGLAGFFAAKPMGAAVHSMFQASNQKKATHKVSEQYSMFYKDDKGNFKPAPVPYKRTEESLNFQNTEPPETLWTKFWKMGAMAVVIIVLLSYLGIWPIITLWWNKKIKPKITAAQAQLEAAEEKKEELTWDAKKIVQSVDEGLAVFDSAIAAAKGTADAAQQSILMASNIVDATARASALETAQHAQIVAQAVCSALTNLKKDFMSAMSRKQDSTTKLLVATLKND